MNVASAGAYRLTLNIGRQNMDPTGNFTSTARLRYNMYYDKTLLAGTQDVCDSDFGGCAVDGAFGKCDTVKMTVVVPYRDIGEHSVAVCGVFSGDVSAGVDNIVFYEVSFEGPMKGGR